MNDLSYLLEPPDEGGPAGPNLEETPAFFELERCLAGKPERQFGETVVPAEPPDYRAAATMAEGLLKESKDLRIVTHLLRALLATRGLAGFETGMDLLRGILDRYWTTLHPALDEDGDATARASALWALSLPDTIQALRGAPLLEARGMGTVYLRDVVQADGSKVKSTENESTLTALPSETWKMASQALERCHEAARAMDEVYRAHVDTGLPDFGPLLRFLARARECVDSYRGDLRHSPSLPGIGTESQVPQGAVPSAWGPGSDPNGGGDVASPRAWVDGSSGTPALRSREDVVRVLEALMGYYAKNEPSSPVPLLLARCKRLATMSFQEIMKDMAPDGLSALRLIAGVEDL